MEGQLVHPCIELSEELRQSLTCSYDEQIAWQLRAYPTHQHQVILEHVSGMAEEGIFSFISTQRQMAQFKSFILCICIDKVGKHHVCRLANLIIH